MKQVCVFRCLHRCVRMSEKDVLMPCESRLRQVTVQLRGTLNTSSNYSPCPQNSRHFDTLYSFSPVVTVLAYSMTKLEITSMQEGIVLDGIALPLNVSFSLVFCCHEVEKKKNMKKTQKGDFIRSVLKAWNCINEIFKYHNVFHARCLPFCDTWKHGACTAAGGAETKRSGLNMQ